MYVKTPKNRNEYGSPWPSRSAATKDVLQNVVDPLVNFANYDNWTFNSNYNHTNQPDGTIDMIVMVWRGLLLTDQWLGEASLGGGLPFTVEAGTKTIKTGYLNANGSGFTAQHWGERDLNYNFHTPVHEYGHWLLGPAHPYGAGGEHNSWGMLLHSGDAVCTNTYERERVAWINPTTITGDILNAPFTDFITTGTAYKYHPSNGATDEYYYFENHQKLSIYDGATRNSNDKGIFVLHFQGPYSESNNDRIKPSSGQFNWENPFNSNCWGVTVPAFRQLAGNRAGYSIRDQLPKSGGGYEIPYAIINENNQAVCGGWYWGEGTIGTFNLTYNDVFSPYSNPYTHTWANQYNSFTMEVFNQNGSIVNARFYLTDPLAGKPSKPQDLIITVYNTGTNSHPKLNWIAAGETDVQSANPGVLIERKINAGSWSQITTLSGTATQYIDYGVSWAGGGPYNAYYRIRFKDTQNKLSLYSDTKSIQYGDVWKIGTEPEDVITEYKLQQNYPNPFNPSTTISFSIPNNGLVTLKVYDIPGTEVAELVNEVKGAGNYSVTFNASELPSGIYFYTLASGNFMATKKLILLK